MKKSTLIISVIILIGLVAFPSCKATKMTYKGGVNVKNLPKKEDKALVYILRPTRIGFAIGMKVKCNEELLGSTKGGKFLYTYLDPGNYTFQTKAENVSELPITLEGGKVYYLQQKIKMGALFARVKLERIFDEGEAINKLKKCSLSSKNFAQI